MAMLFIYDTNKNKSSPTHMCIFVQHTCTLIPNFNMLVPTLDGSIGYSDPIVLTIGFAVLVLIISWEASSESTDIELWGWPVLNTDRTGPEVRKDGALFSVLLWLYVNKCDDGGGVVAAADGDGGSQTFNDDDVDDEDGCDGGGSDNDDDNDNDDKLETAEQVDCNIELALE